MTRAEFEARTVALKAYVRHRRQYLEFHERRILAGEVNAPLSNLALLDPEFSRELRRLARAIDSFREVCRAFSPPERRRQ